MPVNLSIKNAPDEVVARLKERAKRNHRSLQGELVAILQQAATGELWSDGSSESARLIREARDGDFVGGPRTRRILTVREAREHMRRLGVKTDGDATEIIRRDRDER